MKTQSAIEVGLQLFRWTAVTSKRKAEHGEFPHPMNPFRLSINSEWIINSSEVEKYNKGAYEKVRRGLAKRVPVSKKF